MSFSWMIMANCILTAGIAVVPLTTAIAAPCPMTYAQFEAAVPHIDVKECPRHGLGKEAFCRASAGGDFVHVFFFDNDGDQCLLKLRSYGEDAFGLEIKGE